MKNDSELKSDVIEALLQEPSIFSQNISVGAHDGIVTLTGTVPNYAEKWAAERAARRVHGVKVIIEELSVHLAPTHTLTDTDLALAVRSSLKWNVWVPSDINATIDDAWVTLNGNVRWDFQRNSAENAVTYIAGVKGVTNNITLKSDAATAAVKTSIEKALKRDPAVDDTRILVSASGGKVTLAGHVASWAQREEAAATAWREPGVTDVQNEIAVDY